MCVCGRGIERQRSHFPEGISEDREETFHRLILSTALSPAHRGRGRGREGEEGGERERERGREEEGERERERGRGREGEGERTKEAA